MKAVISTRRDAVRRSVLAKMTYLRGPLLA